MTVKEMKKELASLPDDAILIMEKEYENFYHTDSFEDLTGDQEVFVICWGEQYN